MNSTPEPQSTDYDGCNRKCRLAAAHTLVWGECEHGVEPEPTVSLSRVYTATDGFPAIGFDTYTEQQLADLIEPDIGSAELAWVAAHAIVHRNAAAAVSVAVPPTVERRAALSARLWKIAEHHIIAEWICCEPLDPKHGLCAKGYEALGMAKTLLVDSDPEKAWNPAAPVLDAVLAVADAEQADVRAAALREAANALAALGPEDSLASAPMAWTEAIETLRRMAAEAQPATCPHDPDRHGPEAGCVECRCTSTTGHAAVLPQPDEEATR